nr:MAG TPA: hypothetical protein [Caudoviricetes sp.]
MMYFDCINFDRCDSGKFGKYMACIGSGGVKTARTTSQ